MTNRHIAATAEPRRCILSAAIHDTFHDTWTSPDFPGAMP